MRLIDADALISDGGFVHEVDNEVYWEKEDIDHAPTIEAEPVKHGRWIRYDGEDDCECSVCLHWFCVCKSGKNVTVKNANYCPNCGSKLDLEG